MRGRVKNKPWLEVRQLNIGDALVRGRAPFIPIDSQIFAKFV